LLGFLLGDSLEVSEGASSSSAASNSLASTGKDNIKVHAVDTSGGVILDAKIDVLIDTETKVAYLILKT
jgi:hypothetical protein